ncbi:MAG TPA: hypothetical protein DCE48_17195 [Lachnospiraceae bacterium]|uniref:alpha/beta hydrolase n=1 Tax=Anaerosporobacter sp. TaxID=1872529 RepID=UPI000ED6A486|nr:alpha/beta hydrolase [Anaerosporobacter sp.]HAB62401.1 hypothetical protein [Lachnospiraceae bacterium]
MMKERKGNKRGLFVIVSIGVFLISFVGSVLFKMTYISPELRKYSVEWNDEIGSIYTDIAYGDDEANKFDMYVPADSTKETYGLVVYLHAGGFTTGDKADDAKMLQWLCSKGYVAVGINYTLRDDEHPDASVYSQSMEIKAAMPKVVEEAEKLGYTIDKMAISGGSAGGCLALLYAYRDANEAPVPVTMVFEAVGPSSFYPEDWGNYGFDKDTAESREAAAELFGVMAGKEITVDMFGTNIYDEVMKDISALLWVNKDTVPTVMAYGAHDVFQPYLGSVRLNEALEQNGVEHEYFVCEHSGHGLQNDNKVYAEYMEMVEEYLGKYIPVN